MVNFCGMCSLRFLCLFCLFCCNILLCAQTVELRFPYFAGSEYAFTIYQGSKTDTLQAGKIGADGKLSLQLPDNRKDYRGLVSWSLKGGGGLSFVFAGENFTITCLDKDPTENSIVYAHSPENVWLKKQTIEQSVLFGKVDVIYRGKELYWDNKELSAVFDKEMAVLKSSYERFFQTITSSTTYAADYLRMNNFLSGVASHLYAPGEEEPRQADLRHFITEDLNMDALFTSGRWNHVISATFNLFPDKKDFAGAMISNLKRIRSPQVFNVLASDLVTICEQFSWQEAEDIIVYYLMQSGRIEDPQGRIRVAFDMMKVKPGTKALPIKGITDLSNSLLIFYDSDCGNCNAQIDELKSHYAAIQSKGIRVISIAADADSAAFVNYSGTFPWKNRLCDYRGFKGDNFKNYGIFATPTIFLIDKNGKIVGRYARLEDIESLKIHS